MGCLYTGVGRYIKATTFKNFSGYAAISFTTAGTSSNDTVFPGYKIVLVQQHGFGGNLAAGCFLAGVVNQVLFAAKQRRKLGQQYFTFHGYHQVAAIAHGRVRAYAAEAIAAAAFYTQV